MNKPLFLFAILLLGLVLCSVLGGTCRRGGYEGFSSDMSGGTVVLNTGVSGDTSSYSLGPNGTMYSSSTTATNPQQSSYENYDHYSGTAYPTTFYGPNGGTAAIVNTNGVSAVTITDPTGQTTTYTVNGSGSNYWNGQNGLLGYFNQTPTSTSTPTSNSNNTPQQPHANQPMTNQTFYGPNGGSARIFISNNGQYAIEATQPNGNTIIYTSNNSYTYNYPGSMTGNTNAGEPANINYGYVTGPNGNSAGYATGPNGNTYAGYTTNTSTTSSSNPYSSAMPQGIPASMIPPGQEDLYILKSEIVPPVCPACPQSSACPSSKAKCQPCPACARCPEPSFECKKVPNYSSKSNEYLPVPVLSNFSTFGM